MIRNPNSALLTADRKSAPPVLQLLARKLEFFDVLIFVYIAAFVREYFWLLHNNTIAWILTIGVSLVLGYIYLTNKETPKERVASVYWVVVGLPLLLIFFLRVGYADLSFDVLSYHIFHSERALRGLVHIPGDFAPAYFPFFNNPVGDVV